MEFNLVILLLLVLSAADVQTLEGCSVIAEEGETVILPVKVDLPNDSELLQPVINWKNERGGIVHDYWYDHDYNEYQDEHFKGRTSLFKEEIKKGNVSLKINNITKNDEGKYICEVHIEGEIIYSVFLCVTEKEKPEHITESPNPEHSVPTSGHSVNVIGVLIVLAAAALTGVTVFLYRRHRQKQEDLRASDQVLL